MASNDNIMVVTVHMEVGLARKLSALGKAIDRSRESYIRTVLTQHVEKVAPKVMGEDPGRVAYR